LAAPVELHCFGGFVLATCYELPRPTGDVDYLTATPHAGAAIIEALAGEESELAKKHRLHFQRVTIADVPEDYDQRLVRIFAKDFAKLRLLAFEVHDIVLSKLSRNHPKDLEDAQFLAKAGWLDPAILRERYRKELRPNLANERRHDLTLELWLETCFGRR
jgi:Nucleotidyltransferase of unknown function (DUF6036)